MNSNRIRGALYGVAVGDALGAPLEFMTAEQIRKKYGTVMEMIGGGWLNVRPGEITDDTQMSLAVAEGILADPASPCAEVGDRFIEWMASGPKDVGNTCRSAILLARSALQSGEPNTAETWFNAAKRTAEAKGGFGGGNGALMRTIYPSVYYRRQKDARRIANDIGRMTHWDEESAHAIDLYTAMVHMLTKSDFRSIEDCEAQLANTQYDDVELHCRDLEPTGYVVNSLGCALQCCRKAHSFEEAVVMAANLGGDADTIAAITGGLAGAYYGYDAIPRRWIDALSSSVKAQLDRLAKAAVESRKE